MKNIVLLENIVPQAERIEVAIVDDKDLEAFLSIRDTLIETKAKCLEVQKTTKETLTSIKDSKKMAYAIKRTVNGPVLTVYKEEYKSLEDEFNSSIEKINEIEDYKYSEGHTFPSQVLDNDPKIEFTYFNQYIPSPIRKNSDKKQFKSVLSKFLFYRYLELFEELNEKVY